MKSALLCVCLGIALRCAASATIVLNAQTDSTFTFSWAAGDMQLGGLNGFLGPTQPDYVVFIYLDPAFSNSGKIRIETESSLFYTREQNVPTEVRGSLWDISAGGHWSGDFAGQVTITTLSGSAAIRQITVDKMTAEQGLPPDGHILGRSHIVTVFPVPEPSTSLLSIAGMAGLGLRSYRSRKRS